MMKGSRPVGQVAGPAAVCAGMGLIVAVALELLGLYDSIEADLFQRLSFLAGNGVGLGAVPRPVVFGVAAAIVWGLCSAVLTAPGHVRRLGIFFTVFVLTCTLALVLALLGYYFSFFPALVAVLWGGSCSLIYAAQHTMPVDDFTR